MKILADENVDFPTIYHLRDNGFDVLSIAEDDFGIIDENVLAKAVRTNAVLLTAEKAVLILALFNDQKENLIDAFTVLTAHKTRIIRGE
ncbi:DUF5615 family PIN-like protein [Spirosoma koreense]